MKNVWNGAKVVVPGVWAKHGTAAVVGKRDAGDILRYGCSSLFILCFLASRSLMTPFSLTGNTLPIYSNP